MATSLILLEHAFVVVHSNYGEDARVLVNGFTCTVSMSSISLLVRRQNHSQLFKKYRKVVYFVYFHTSFCGLILHQIWYCSLNHMYREMAC